MSDVETVSTGTAAANTGAVDTGGAPAGGTESGAGAAAPGTTPGVEAGSAAKVEPGKAAPGAQDTAKPGAADQKGGTDAKTGAAEQPGGEQVEGAPDTEGDEHAIGRLQELRAMLAGGDEKFLKQLERFKTPESLARGLREAYNLAKESGKGKAPVRLGDKATPEEIKAFREAVGIPDDPEQYPVSYREEFKASERDNEILKDVKAYAVEKNIDPKATSAFVEWYEDLNVANQQRLDERLAQTAKATQNALTAEWGAEYKGNITGVQELLKTHLGDEGADQFYNLRLADGSRMQDNIGMVKMLASIASDYYGSNAIIVGDVEAAGQTTQQQIDDLLQLRVKDPDKYNSPDVQAKINALFARKSKLDGRK
ncbi:hypothetical protein [Agrobacterium vitis]|uniref:hypothetical protein n=1 Tax=Agrobacterium vitis TaxID=373 RepID=UPI001F41D4BC|nr:hypothetical protein [Agrobacterium vitis]